MAELELPHRPKYGSQPIYSSLSERGVQLSASGAMLDKFRQILGNAYDPVSNPRGIINIGTAENYLMLQDAADFIAKNMERVKPSSKDFGYGDGPWGSPRIREAMANHINRHFKPLKSIETNKLLFANGVTSLCEMLGFSICDENEAVLLSKPIYQAFKSDFGAKARVKCIFTSFHGTDQFNKGGVAEYENAIMAANKEGIRIRALVICHPHNPLGRCYTPEALIALMELCNKYKIHLLADEIYALSVYKTNETRSIDFQSILTLDVDRYIDPDYLHLLYGMSKDMAGGGLRLGCIYTHNEALLRAMSAISPFHWPSSGSERIAALMLEDQNWMDGFLDRSRTRLADSSQAVRKMLDDEGITYCKDSNAGLFLWVNLCPAISKASFAKNDYRDGWSYEDTLTEELIKNGVYLINGKEMNAEEPGWYRLIFAQDEELVREGINRMVQVLKAKTP